jgi:hypothetical protein
MHSGTAFLAVHAVAAIIGGAIGMETLLRWPARIIGAHSRRCNAAFGPDIAMSLDRVRLAPEGRNRYCASIIRTVN